jgi:hypothetical protein
MLNELDLLKPKQESHLSHGSIFSVGLKQFIVFAKILAHVVFPTPRGPQNKYA